MMPSAGPPWHQGRAWSLAFLVFFLINAAWALASPYDGSPDEVRQIIRAAGVVEGQIFARPAPSPATGGGASMFFNSYCYYWDPARSAACAPVPGGKGASIRHTYITGAGRYNPIYYAAVGEPLVRYVMDRWQSGIGPGHSLNPLSGNWRPVTGSGLRLLLMTLGLALLGLLAWHAVGAVGEHSTDLREKRAPLVEVPSG